MAHYMLMFIDDEWDDALDAARASSDAEIKKWWADLTAKGVLKKGGALDHKRNATTVRRVNGKMQVFDGPFIETKEHVGGYVVIEVPDRDAAIAVAKSWPAGTVEVRPVVER